MPKLLIFVPCERIIVSREGPISLITILESLNVTMPADEYDKLPDDAVAPINWHVFTKWMREDGEEPQHWQQRVQISTPSGRVATNALTDIDLVANLSVRGIVQVNGFPIKPLGVNQIALSLRQAGADDDAWQEIATYPAAVGSMPPPA